jgi:hypothetical protein
MFLGMGVNYSTNESNTINFAETAAGTTKVSVVLNSDGSITYTGGRTGANILPQGTWFFLEIGIVVASSGGSLIIKVNNQIVVSENSFDTNNGNASYAYINQIQFSTLSPGNSITIDDVYVADGTGAAPYNTFQGDNRIYTLSVNAAGDSAQWTPSSGSNYQNVETLGSTYNASSTAGQTDLFHLTGLPSSVTSVIAVQVTGVYAKSDATDHTVQQCIKSGGVLANGTGFLSPYALTNNELWYSDDPVVNDPSTGEPFTLSALTAGAIQIGYSLAS